MHEILAPYVEQGLISKKKHPTLDLWIADYTPKCSFDEAWDDVTKVCRGLVIDGNGLVVSRCLPKFFNAEQHKEPLPPLDQAEVYEKMDGSLIIASFFEGDLLVNTRGSFTSPQAQAAHRLLYGMMFDLHMEEDFTYLFEYMAPWNRIVVNHGEEEQLTLLAKINTETGEEADVTFVHEWEGPRVARYVFFDESQLTWENLKADRPNHEGYVLFWRDQGLRLKLKHADYIRLHRIVTRVNAVDVWECLRNAQDLRPWLEGVPDEFYSWVRDEEERLRMRYCEIAEAAHFFFERAPQDDRKTFAQYTVGKGHPYTAALFTMFDGRPYEDLIWKAIKPRATSPFLDSGERMAA